MKVVAIIQARMGSTRLPGKVLQDIAGETMLARVVRRTKHAALVHELVVATTVKPFDKIILGECQRLGVCAFRGDEQDVLDRYYQTAKAYEAEAVVRITSDCPLIDPGVVDDVVRTFLDEKPDYASNSLVRTYPYGLDTEVMTTAALERAWRDARERYQRAHVTPYIYQNPGLFRLSSVVGKVDYSSYRWTVDTQEDLDFIRAVYSRLPNKEDFSWLDVLTLLAREPALSTMNRHIQQKPLEQG